MNPAEQQCAAILAAAMSSSFGIVVGASDVIKARAMLYRTRQMLGDVSLDALQIRVSPDDSEHELWIIHRQKAPEFALLGLLDEGTP